MVEVVLKKPMDALRAMAITETVTKGSIIFALGERKKKWSSAFTVWKWKVEASVRCWRGKRRVVMMVEGWLVIYFLWRREFLENNAVM